MNFPVIEFRRYSIQEGKREAFGRYFDAYFPEAIQQTGAIAFGQFYEREIATGFTWMRGFISMEARAQGNEALYSGPVWKEHAGTMNDLMTDHTNVLLLTPLRPEQSIPVLKALDPVTEDGAKGVIVGQIFAVEVRSFETFVSRAEAEFAKYPKTDRREAGTLVTLDVPNNFPRLPFRTDGPYLVRLDILEDRRSEAFCEVAKRVAAELATTGMLRERPELLILDPTPRSRLRWLPLH